MSITEDLASLLPTTRTRRSAVWTLGFSAIGGSFVHFLLPNSPFLSSEGTRILLILLAGTAILFLGALVTLVLLVLDYKSIKLQLSWRLRHYFGLSCFAPYW